MIAQTGSASAPYSLVADIGGTNSRVAMARGGEVLHASIRRFANARYPGPEAVLRAYLAGHDGPAPQAACLAIAGALEHGPAGEAAHMTNLDWHLSAASLRQATGARRVRLLNDLQAQGHALAQLPADALQPVLPGAPAPALPRAAPRLVVGLGTGFNASPVHPLAGQTLVPAAEAGHAQLSLIGAQEQALGQHLADENGLVRIESLLSGPGLARAHGFFAPGAATLGPAEVVRAAGHDRAAEAALRIFVRILGRVVADLALIHLPLAGIYLTGGVARALAPFLESHDFANSFHGHATLSRLLRQIPVALIRDDYAALTGCALALSQETA